MMTLATLVLLNMAKEFMQMYQQGVSYALDLVNYAEWTLYATSLAFVLPMVLTGMLHPYQWQCGAVAVFLAWFNLLLYLQRYACTLDRHPQLIPLCCAV